MRRLVACCGDGTLFPPGKPTSQCSKDRRTPEQQHVSDCTILSIPLASSAIHLFRGFLLLGN